MKIAYLIPTIALAIKFNQEELIEEVIVDTTVVDQATDVSKSIIDALTADAVEQTEVIADATNEEQTSEILTNNPADSSVADAEVQEPLVLDESAELTVVDPPSDKNTDVDSSEAVADLSTE